MCLLGVGTAVWKRGDAGNAAAQPCCMRVDVSGIGARVAVRVRADLEDVADVFGIAWHIFEEKVKARQSFFVHIRVDIFLVMLDPSINHFTRIDAEFEAVYADVFILVVRSNTHQLVQSRGCKTIRSEMGQVADFTCTPTPREPPSIAGDRRYTSATTLAEGVDGVFHAHHDAGHVHVE